jgi:hypothetical protein
LNSHKDNDDAMDKFHYYAQSEITEMLASICQKSVD